MEMPEVPPPEELLGEAELKELLSSACRRK